MLRRVARVASRTSADGERGRVEGSLTPTRGGGGGVPSKRDGYGADVTCPGDDRVLLTANSAMVTRTGGAPWKATCAAPGRPRKVATGSDGQGMNARIEPTAFCTCTMLGGGGAGLVVQNQ